MTESALSLGIGRAATLLKTLLQYYGKSLEALPGVAYPGFRDNRSTLNTKTGYKKTVEISNSDGNRDLMKIQWSSVSLASIMTQYGALGFASFGPMETDPEQPAN